MTNEELSKKLDEAQETIRTLQEELAETNRGLTHLAMELEERVDRRTAELRQSRSKLEGALASMTFAAMLINEDGRVDFANQAFCDIFNLKESPAELKTLTSREMLEKIRPAYLNPDEALAHITEIVARGLLVQDEEVPMLGGRTFLRDFIPIRSGDNKYGRLWIHKEITERKRAEEALRESERFRRAVLDALPAKIAVLDAHGVVTAVNERWKELEIGSNLLDFSRQAAASGEASAAEAVAILDSVLKGERTEGSVEYPCHTATEQQWFMMQVIHASEHVGGAIVSHLDITARMKAEESVRQSAEELKRSNHDLEQFAYIAGHDLQEPLRMVTGLMGLLRDGYRGKQLDAKADQYIDFAVDGANRMSTMIKDLLEYSRTGNKGLKMAAADIADIVNAVQANLRRIIGETQAVITHDPLPTVTADESQMMQVFQNLIGNAIKFRAPDRHCQVHVGAAKKDGHWMFSVRDNGIGIDSKQADRVFLLFQRLHTRDKYPGSGIGLAICKKIVERHGGRIWVESIPAEGSTFYFTLPVPG